MPPAAKAKAKAKAKARARGQSSRAMMRHHPRPRQVQGWIHVKHLRPGDGNPYPREALALTVIEPSCPAFRMAVPHAIQWTRFVHDATCVQHDSAAEGTPQVALPVAQWINFKRFLKARGWVCRIENRSQFGFGRIKRKKRFNVSLLTDTPVWQMILPWKKNPMKGKYILLRNVQGRPFVALRKCWVHEYHVKAIHKTIWLDFNRLSTWKKRKCININDSCHASIRDAWLCFSEKFCNCCFLRQAQARTSCWCVCVVLFWVSLRRSELQVF